MFTSWSILLFLPSVILCAKVRKETAVDNRQYGLDGISVARTKPVNDVLNASASNTTKKTVCTSESCKKIAHQFLSRINSSVDPCGDFFQYACGQWISSNEIPDNETEISESYFLTLKMRKVGQNILKTKRARMFASEAKAKSIFRQCINEVEIERLRARPLLNILDEYTNGWPILQSDWDPSQFDIVDTLVKNFFIGNEPFFSVSVSSDVENPLINLIEMDSASTYATVDVLNDAITGKLYTESMLSFVFNITSLLLKDVHHPLDVNRFSANLTEIVELERSFGMAKLTAVENTDDSIYLNKMTLAGFQKQYNFNSSIMRNVTSIIRAYFAAANLSKEITDNTTVVVLNPRFWPVVDAKLVELEALGDEGKRRIANYIGWQLLSIMPPYLAKDYRDALAEYNQKITGRKTKTDPPAGERCLEVVTQLLPLSVGAMYVRDVVPRSLKQKATTMVKDIQIGFRELLESASWMDNATYHRALVKLDSIINVVGYPEIFLTNTTAIDKEYRFVSIQPTYVETVVRSAKNAVIQQLQRLPKANLRYDPVIDTRDITEVNAFYMPNNNVLTLLAAILQLPFYDSQSPQYLNYGAIGYIIGHETTHGFDNIGSKYDAQGFRRVWWTNTTAALYEARKKGMVQQYGNYTLPAGRVNGQLTLGENIADNGGLRAAYKGYVNYLRRLSGPEPVLPGLEDYTSLQLFFLSAGQAWCNKQRIESERVSLLTETHSLNRFRVNGVVSNMPEFSATFNCSAKARMNPSVKQVVW